MSNRYAITEPRRIYGKGEWKWEVLTGAYGEPDGRAMAFETLRACKDWIRDNPGPRAEPQSEAA